jgi:hypothetical protein
MAINHTAPARMTSLSDLAEEKVGSVLGEYMNQPPFGVVAMG